MNYLKIIRQNCELCHTSSLLAAALDEIQSDPNRHPPRSTETTFTPLKFPSTKRLKRQITVLNYNDSGVPGKQIFHNYNDGAVISLKSK